MPRRTCTEPSRQDVRTRILAAAYALLAEAGAAALTQPRVAREAGISQSHLTYYFPTRADLLLAVARHSLDAVTAELHAAVAAAPEQRGERGAAVLAAALTDKRRIRLLLGLVAASDEDPGIKTSLAHFISSVRAALRRELAEMGAASDESSAALLHAAGVGLAVMNLARDSDASRREVRETLQSVIGRLIQAGPESKGPRHDRKK